MFGDHGNACCPVCKGNSCFICKLREHKCEAVAELTSSSRKRGPEDSHLPGQSSLKKLSGVPMPSVTSGACIVPGPTFAVPAPRQPSFPQRQLSQPQPFMTFGSPAPLSFSAASLSSASASSSSSSSSSSAGRGGRPLALVQRPPGWIPSASHIQMVNALRQKRPEWDFLNDNVPEMQEFLIEEDNERRRSAGLAAVSLPQYGMTVSKVRDNQGNILKREITKKYLKGEFSSTGISVQKNRRQGSANYNVTLTFVSQAMLINFRGTFADQLKGNYPNIILELYVSSLAPSPQLPTLPPAFGSSSSSSSSSLSFASAFPSSYSLASSSSTSNNSSALSPFRSPLRLAPPPSGPQLPGPRLSSLPSLLSSSSSSSSAQRANENEAGGEGECCDNAALNPQTL